jgi:DNA-binding transcriptional MocR family regulator
MGLGRWLVRTVWRMTIDPASFEPVYRQLARILRDQIRSGELRAGAMVGSEASLSQRFGVGRDAVRDALTALRSEGLVITERAWGRSCAARPSTWKSCTSVPGPGCQRGFLPTMSAVSWGFPRERRS